MSLNAAHFRNLGTVSFAAGQSLPGLVAKSWQEKAFVAGWIEASKTFALVNKSQLREQRKMDAIVARGAARRNIHEISVLNKLTRSQRRASLQFVSHNIVRSA